MGMLDKTKLIGGELKNHLPFTLLGAATGIVFMLAGRKWFAGQAETLFTVFHPLHVVLSAMVTAALFEIHRKAKNFLIILVIGVVGSIGVATMSDCILPFFGESILGVAIPKHADLHAHQAEPQAAEDVHEHTADCVHNDEADTEEHVHTDECAHGHEPDPTDTAHEHSEGCGHPILHLGFIEEWYLVFPAAIIGVLLAYFKPTTHLPHASHVLLSTWASSAHILMNTQAEMSPPLLAGMFMVLFLAVWLPCCVSDIVFPLLFIGSDGQHHPHSCVFCRKKDTRDES